MLKISVCVATYNGATYIAAQLRSILPQLGINDEIIISDDGSSDDTLSIINAFNDPRIIIFNNHELRSPSFNFENALKHCSGDLIFLSDQDDVWAAGKVDILRHLLARFDIIVSDCYVVDTHLKILHNSFFKINKSKKGLLNNIIKNSYLGCCLAFKKDVLKIALPFPKNIPMHDWWIGVVGEVFFKTCFVPYQLVYYRRHGANASIAGSKSDFSIVQKIRWRFHLIVSLCVRCIKKALL
jgi:glycosyltransferase involved in cell wall biosynthesis